jgi:ATP-dependent Clp protease ATP-binding subunit ClpA
VRVLSLDHVALLGGTTYRGQYEARVEALVDEVTQAGNVILFIDELHNLIGQGSAMGAAMDGGNMLKPALVRGEFRVIGATTGDEYDRWICGDPALERRFQRVDVSELSAADTRQILDARTARLERHHGVVIAAEALDAAVELSDEYIVDRARPDRAIDALDEACAHTQARARYSDATARLLAERRAMLGDRGGEPREPMAAAQDVHEEADSWERLARSGFTALERLGAELEAAISDRLGEVSDRFGGARPRERVGDRVSRTGVDAKPSAGASADSPSVGEPARRRPLAELDELVRARLMEDGIVVRGHDVARAVAAAVNRTVAWRGA